MHHFDASSNDARPLESLDDAYTPTILFTSGNLSSTLLLDTKGHHSSS